MRTLIVANIVSVDRFYSSPNDDVMAMPFAIVSSMRFDRQPRDRRPPIR